MGKRQEVQVTVGAVQMKFHHDIAANVDSICRQIRSAAERRVDMLLFPECALTGYNRDFHTVLQAEVIAGLAAVAQSARASHCNVLVGAPTWSGERCFNTLLVFNRKGKEVFRYSKIHLTRRDQRFFQPGNTLAFFRLDGIGCTAMICHERRYPELVRLPVMLGAQLIFHPNAGLDSLPVSKAKRKGRDGIATRAFENAVYYIFANSVGPQGDGLWSAGDSKIVSPGSQVLALANNRDEALIQSTLDLSLATRSYALEALKQPAFLQKPWAALLQACRDQWHQSGASRS
ncbi:MAG: carbon-nitrogen hydrolase family protein [Verrucomicrobiota bacterium]